VRDGVNGFIVPAADPEALARALDWCLTHRADLAAMRAAARATAAAWQWSDYRRRLTEELLASPILSGLCVEEAGERR
jgi:glycosyltransferase involved in cell wall biosynthesis